MMRFVLSIPLRALMLSFAMLLLGGCASYGKVILEDEGGSVMVEVNKGPGHGHYESRLPNIPPGHMPPPGKCRIWYPGEPPGQQPPPGDCYELKRQVPPGAWLVRG